MAFNVAAEEVRISEWDLSRLMSRVKITVRLIIDRLQSKLKIFEMDNRYIHGGWVRKHIIFVISEVLMKQTKQYSKWIYTHQFKMDSLESTSAFTIERLQSKSTIFK